MTEFAPPLGWAGAVVTASLLLAAALAGLGRGWRQAWPRLLLAPAALPLLLDPQRTAVERAPQRPFALAVVDDSASMGLEDRRSAADSALARLRASAPGVEWRVVRAAPKPGEPTRLQAVLDRGLAAAPAGRLGGVVVMSDGAVADASAGMRAPPGVPMHVLIAGRRDPVDRRLRIVRAPPFARVGEAARVMLAVDGPGEAVPVRWWAQGKEQPPLTVSPGETVTVALPIRMRGPVELAFEAAALPGELTAINNRALVRLNGVREGLNVLLVSGAPYPGGRVWRDLLKSDGAVRLTQFTILRLPSSFDAASPEELALIPFPVEQLFAERLPRFDLVVFDRFALSGLIGDDRLARVADYVRGGGALLVASGPEFAADGGLARTPVARALPARLAGPAASAPFRPALTPAGAAHPITAPFAVSAERWGNWPDMVGLTPLAGAETLMAGEDRRPLLVIGEVGRGRAAMLASTGLWWWARDVDGEGPQAALLRRLIHWLMREPELEARRLEVATGAATLRISASGARPPTVSTVTPLSSPAPGPATAVPLTAGRGAARVADGLYRVEAGGAVRLALAGEAAEFADPRARAEPLEASARASGGAIRWLADGVPALRLVGPDDSAAGRGWIGVRRPQGGAVVAAHREPVVPPWLAWALPTGVLALSWWRERR